MRLFKRKKDARAKGVVGHSTLWPPSKFSLRQYGFVVIGLLVVAGGVALFAAGPEQTQPIPVGNPTYINANHILPKQQTSFYDQPWRAYMDTVPATTLLNGIGTHYIGGASDAATLDATLKYLSSIGIRNIRREVPWALIDPNNENQFSNGAPNLTNFLVDCKKYNITPTILLNANDGDPEPNFPSHTGILVHAAPVGATQITLSGVAASDIVVHQPNTAMGASGISDNSGTKARFMFTKMVKNKDDSLTLTVSKPLSAALAAGSKQRVDYLKYMPLYAVGTPEFNNTMAGWNTYVTTTGNLMKSVGITKFNVEIWNELTFGAAILDANRYILPHPNSDAVDGKKMQPGGFDWELANQTTQNLKSMFGSNVTVGWGFSNTSFYTTAVTNLPPNTDAESFHPGGAGLISIPATHEPYSFNQLIDGPYIPNISQEMPESTFAQGWKFDNLIRNKLFGRLYKQPPGTAHFNYWMTEAGYSPAFGKQHFSKAVNEQLKAKAALRQYSFWLNKGLTLYNFGSPYEPGSRGDTQGTKSLLAYNAQNGANPATTQSEAIGHFTAQFAGATALTAPRNLGVGVWDITPNDNTPAYQVFPADKASKEPALNYREMFQFLPFQVTNNKFVISTYVNSWNITTPPPPMNFRLDITNVNGKNATVSYYDPIANTTKPITVVSRSANDIVVEIESIDSPRLISIIENNPGRTPSVSVTSPADGGTVGGSTTLKATASDNTKSVQFQLDGANIGPALTASPYTYRWDTQGVPNSTRGHVLSALATNAAGVTATASITIHVFNADVTPPTAPVLGHSTITTNSIKVNWGNTSTDNPGGSGIAGYKIYRDGKLVGTTQDIFYTDTKLKPGTTYVYTATAYDVAGNVSTASAPLSLTTKSN